MLDWITLATWALLGGATGALVLAYARRASRRRAQPATWERRFWALTLCVAAFVYLAFAAAGGAQARWWMVEVAGLLAYGALAWSSERFGRPALVVGWLTHAAWDLGLHGSLPAHVPAWYLPACAGFDLVVGFELLAASMRERAAQAPSA